MCNRMVLCSLKGHCEELWKHGLHVNKLIVLIEIVHKNSSRIQNTVTFTRFKTLMCTFLFIFYFCLFLFDASL